MLIENDFELEEDPEESPRPAAGADAEVPGPITTPRLPGGSSEPSPEIVIIESRGGFSRRIFALAVVALILSATLRICHTRHSNADSMNDRTGIQTEPSSRQADPDDRPRVGIRRATEVGREKPARRDNLRKEAGSRR